MSSPVASPVKLTAMYNAHQELGAVFTHREGWRLPARYTSAGEEMDLARKAAGVCDISPVGKLDLQGDAVLDELSRVLALQGSLKVGRVVRCPNPTASEDGGDAVMVAGLSYDEAMVFTSSGEALSVAGFLEEGLDGCAHLVDVTSSWAGVCVLGPRSPRVLSRLVELDLDPAVFADGSCAQGKAAEVHVLVIRSDIGDLLAYEVYVTRDYGEYLWDALLHAGGSEGVGPIGVEALDGLRAGA